MWNLPIDREGSVDGHYIKVLCGVFVSLGPASIGKSRQPYHEVTTCESLNMAGLAFRRSIFDDERGEGSFANDVLQQNSILCIKNRESRTFFVEFFVSAD